jgi:hypothetical protein
MTKNLEFFHFSVQINQEISLNSLSYPGVFGIQCDVTQRILILGAKNLLVELEGFFLNVDNGLIKNQKFLEDLKIYGKKNFTVFIFDGDFELENGIKRQRAINYYKKLYQNKLYD